VLIGSLLFSTHVYAQENQLPDPGITPDSPFYFFDNFGKNVGLFFAFGPNGKARKALEYARERLSEARAMANQNDTNGLVQAAEGYSKFIALAAEKAVEMGQDGGTEDPSEIVASAILKHLSVLDNVADTFPENVPEQARQAISRARDASIKGMENSLQGLAKENPALAAEIAMAGVEERLNRARSKIAENESEEVQEAIDEAEQLFDFGAEISEIARGLGKDTTTVDQLIAKATSTHLTILAEVYNKVPEQAKSAIEGAMTKAAEGQQNAIDALESKGVLGSIPPSVQLPDSVPQHVRDRILDNATIQTGKPSELPGKPETPGRK